MCTVSTEIATGTALPDKKMKSPDKMVLKHSCCSGTASGNTVGRPPSGGVYIQTCPSNRGPYLHLHRKTHSRRTEQIAAKKRAVNKMFSRSISGRRFEKPQTQSLSILFGIAFFFSWILEPRKNIANASSLSPKVYFPRGGGRARRKIMENSNWQHNLRTRIRGND